MERVNPLVRSNTPVFSDFEWHQYAWSTYETLLQNSPENL